MMEALLGALKGLREVRGRWQVETGRTGETAPCVAVAPREVEVVLAAGAAARLVVVHAEADARAQVRIELAEGAQFELTEVFPAAGVEAQTTLVQAAGSRCRLTTVLLAGAAWHCTGELDGRDAGFDAGVLFVAGGEEHCRVQLRTNHRAAGCRSESVVKGVAGGSASGQFRGLVYVAPGAQQTDARQQSRNILLGDGARIESDPQLEIYADDVKCSHGATVGQLDADSVLYMRQRGLSEQQARRLQIEGFAGDVVRGCTFEPLREALAGMVADKLDTI